MNGRQTTCRLFVSRLALVGMLTTKETVAVALAGSLVAMCLNGVFGARHATRRSSLPEPWQSSRPLLRHYNGARLSALCHVL
jgi:hypothetical protein